MPGRIDLDIKGATEVGQLLNRIASEIEPAMITKMRDAARSTTEVMKGNVKVVTGSFRSSINYDMDISGRQVTATIGPRDSQFGGDYAGAALEEGRSPGSAPPAEALQIRYGISLAAAIKASKTISEQFTPGTFFVRRTGAQVRGILQQSGIEIFRQVVHK